MPQAYLGDPARAHRLNAARRAAGFASVHAAAAKFGWSLATYRAHEGATRRMDEEAARRYAGAFGVEMDWLWSDRGQGPEPDKGRVAKYEARARHAAERIRNDPAEQAFVRLRIARRLAGFWTVKGAAEFLDVSRTTLAAHEAGQNRISVAMANLYGEAFGVHANWLRLGKSPSGYPPHVDAILDRLAELHDESEMKARADYPPPRPGPSRRPPDVAEPARASNEPAKPAVGDAVPEVSLQALIGALSPEHGLDIQSIRPERIWRFPEKFLLETWSCRPRDAVIVVATEGSSTSAAGDRIIVDVSVRSPLGGGVYALVGPNGIRTGEASPRERGVIGRACGIVGSLRAR